MENQTKISNIAHLDLEKSYSYADYLTWQFSEIVELIRGKVFRMSPAPKSKHQAISRNLTILLGIHFKRKTCRLYEAPFDVRLSRAKDPKEITTVVQPDLCVICDIEKIDENGCLGAPDLVIEILSKGNSKKEMQIKYELYCEVGVREYWIIDPEREHIFQFILQKDFENPEKNMYFLKKIYLAEDKITAHIFPDLQFEVAEVFED
ncbi:Uma2 family endonuclease [Hugenholtzia roseola]|uniref:Uma2 family endonuclease n=1 Tax=Hugenholtzia roseola TaxID=1002 RepID=UPI00040255AF|nr:Uma2 family endonuclease [Hugenholtzia roseola]